MRKKVNALTIIYLVLAGISLAGFISFALLVTNEYTFRIDKFNILVLSHRNAFLTGFFKIFTYLGSFYVLALVVFIVFLVVYFIYKKRVLALSFLTCFILTSILNAVLKTIVKRPRPESLMIIEELGYSFPSGHAMMSLAVFGFFIYFALKFIENKPLKISLVVLFSAVVILIGFSRIYLGVHYLSDILAGWLISFVILLFSTITYNIMKSHKSNY